jgi:hypothetical protein
MAFEVAALRRDVEAKGGNVSCFTEITSRDLGYPKINALSVFQQKVPHMGPLI